MTIGIMTMQPPIGFDLVLKRADRQQGVAGRQRERPVGLRLPQLLVDGLDRFQVAGHPGRGERDVGHQPGVLAADHARAPGRRHFGERFPAARLRRFR